MGRTGAGKTSLVSALLRLAEPTGGSIVIDGINVGTIGLHDLRKNMSIIPQVQVSFLIVPLYYTVNRTQCCLVDQFIIILIHFKCTVILRYGEHWNKY